jgi:hypothetical protein
MAASVTQAPPHPGGEVSDEALTIEAGPLCLKVPLGDLKETDLMAALEFVVTHWRASRYSDEPEREISRAVSWLSEKYGSP